MTKGTKWIHRKKQVAINDFILKDIFDLYIQI